MATANRPRNRKRRNARAADDANLNALAEGLQRALKRKVRIFKRRGRSPGRIEIDYYDDNDLTAVAEMLLGNSRARCARSAGKGKSLNLMWNPPWVSRFLRQG